jgi:hypothetical protein
MKILPETETDFSCILFHLCLVLSILLCLSSCSQSSENAGSMTKSDIEKLRLIIQENALSIKASDPEMTNLTPSNLWATINPYLSKVELPVNTPRTVISSNVPPPFLAPTWSVDLYRDIKSSHKTVQVLYYQPLGATPATLTIQLYGWRGAGGYAIRGSDAETISRVLRQSSAK